MFIHQDINYEMLETKPEEIECIGIKIPKMNMKIINVYKPPKLSNFQNFRGEIPLAPLHSSTNQVRC